MATVTLNFSAAHATRIQDALTTHLSLEVPATQQDYKDFLIEVTKSFVNNQEKKAAILALAAGPDVDIT